MPDQDTVRLLTGLTAEELSNNSIDSLLDLNEGNIKLAAADALETFAGQLATISVQSDDISIDGSKRATLLMARAARLRDQVAVAADEDGFFFGIVDGAGCRAELTEREPW